MVPQTLTAGAEGTVTEQVWWPTSIVVAEHRGIEDFNARLAAIILQKEREITQTETPLPIAGVESGLTAYWTKYNVLNWPFPECGQLATMFLSAVRRFIRGVADPEDPRFAITGISCWANVLRSGQSLNIHHHDPGFISAHYIVQGGRNAATASTDESGNTVYYRPGFIERSHGDVFGGPWDADWRISVPPVDGTLTVFPSYVRHEVKTHIGQVERITVALDVYIKKQRVPFHFAPPRWYVPHSTSARVPTTPADAATMQRGGRHVG